jgi:hypothetical protein
MKKEIYYMIKKSFLSNGNEVIMNNGLGEVLELNDYETVKLLVETMNANTDNNCKYSIVKSKNSEY